MDFSVPIDQKRAGRMRFFGHSNKPEAFRRSRGGSLALRVVRGPVWMPIFLLFSLEVFPGNCVGPRSGR